MHNNYFFLRKLAEELNDLLKGTQLLCCFSQEKDEAILGFSGEIYMRCILKPDFSAVSIVESLSRARKNTVSLWTELYETAVVEVGVFKNERALKIVLSGGNVLVIKLFGNRPNLLVYRGGVQVAMFNNALLGDKALKLEDFDRNMADDLATYMSVSGNFRKQFFTFGKVLAEEADRRMAGLEAEAGWTELQSFVQYLAQPRYFLHELDELPKLSLLQGEEQPTALAAINEFVNRYRKTVYTQRLKSALQNQVLREMARTQSYINTTQNKLDELVSGVRNEELGNILMAHLHRIKEGIAEVELENFYTGEPVKIKLKKELSAQKNAESYYRKSKNEKIELETASANLEAARAKLCKLEETLQELGKAEGMRELKTLSKHQHPEKKSELPFKEYQYKGTKIWVGRNAKNNDLLLTQYSHKDDWWLHARDTPGSHVVIKNPSPSAEMLEFAASLAAWFSKRKSEKLVTVIYTQKKYVRKAKNLAAGQVIVEKEKTLLVEPAEG